jgi:hypothetical protein
MSRSRNRDKRSSGGSGVGTRHDTGMSHLPTLPISIGLNISRAQPGLGRARLT